ncbi:MAG TPA: hypothetical protein VK762_29505 [Polyangiaceae bacterium]|jgi:hypothetical protein|nr:hypothetical protein [Polyangiaceae bacterium]
MRPVSHAASVLVILGCQACSAASSSETPVVQCPAGQHALSTSCAWDPVEVAIGPGTDASGCPVFSPNPVSAHENQLVEWTNNTSASLTVFQFEGTNNGVPATPLTTVNAGATSGGIFWSNAGSIAVYPSGCSSASGGTIIVTVN